MALPCPYSPLNKNGNKKENGREHNHDSKDGIKDPGKVRQHIL